jgi:hypothetical protein
MKKIWTVNPFFFVIRQKQVLVQLGFNLSNWSNWHTWVEYNTDLFWDMQKYLHMVEWLDNILD